MQLAPSKDQLFLTALPNGRQADKRLRLSVLLTPALNNQTLTEPFVDWPDVAGRLRWTVRFFDLAMPNHNPITVALPTTIDGLSGSNMDSDLWKEIFRDPAKHKKRTGTDHLHRTWRLSHNITRLYNRHVSNRLAHAYKEFAENRNMHMGTDLATFQGHAATIQEEMTPPVLFLHPGYNTDLAKRFDDRAEAVNRCEDQLRALRDLDYRTTVESRIQYAIKKLEIYGGAKLSAVSLCGVYILCMQSAVPAGAKDASVDRSVATIQGWFPMPNPGVFRVAYPSIDLVIEYLKLLLFHRRNSTKRDKRAIKKPDFHQLLGMVHNYPAMMRTLGLVYDLVVTPPIGSLGDCAVLVDLDTSYGSGPQINGELVVSSLFTRCTVPTDDFFATPQTTGLVQHGLLNLRAQSKQPKVDSIVPKRFTLVPESADSQALKLTDRTNNVSRGIEYFTSAPTMLKVSGPPPAPPLVATPQASANPTTASPAPRSVGLALFDQDRLNDLEQNVGKTAPVDDQTTPKPGSDFFAEDLILGYRVDIRYKDHFYSLCRRDSKYHIYSPRTEDKKKTWIPGTDMEKGADEGFISFSASQSTLDGNGTDASNSQTQVHQSLFTWTGWALSVPQPGIPEMNPPQDSVALVAQTAQKHLAIRPCYQLPKDVKVLPPLRFEGDYLVRCRVADLAGNGPGPDTDPMNILERLTLAPAPKFSRHEPIRAPHFLLLHAIDRVNEPGTHIDRMVARDNDKRSSRMLVPPRESLRMAELSGILKNDRLPKTAFGEQQLLEDGSFPSVACAKSKAWISGRIDCPADNDPIFLNKADYNTVKNPYYPDPLANFIRIEAFDLTDDSSQSRPISPAVLLGIGTGKTWPDYLPARVRLIPTDGGEPAIEKHELAELEETVGLKSVPTIDVKVPKGSSVVLKISSAAVDGRAGSPEYPVHLYRLSELHTDKPKDFSELFGGNSRGTMEALGLTLQAKSENPLRSSHNFVDGTLSLVTPWRTMTLIHAVKQPLEVPEFGASGTAGALQVVRGPGQSEAKVAGALRAHWPSTGKITCYAEWTDQVDDITRAKHYPVHHREVAFTVTAKELKRDIPYPATRFRTMVDSLLEHFLDTRAHNVTYSLVATSNFREYYPGADKPEVNDKRFQRRREDNDKDNPPLRYMVLSSARPKAPKITYIIPAFVWANTYDKAKKTWHTGRTVVLRVYVERPFLLSGDRETIGVVLYDPHSGVAPEKQNYVSRWGADPTRPITTPILRNELDEVNLCQADQPVQNCVLAEGDKARIKPCTIEYSDERKLWFADIPIDTQQANAPFVRLALVRWQPDALTGVGESRCSQVVFAEFMQISPERWVSVQKRSGSKYAITVSGAFANLPASKPFTMTLQKRWFALGRDTGWRDVSSTSAFSYTPADTRGVSTWSTELQTPHSAYLCKYRVLLREREFPDQEGRKSFFVFVDLP